MTQPSDAQVRAELERELERLRAGDPFTALSLGYDAGGDAIRAAFLDATKTYHPNRFGRRAPDVRALATEIFLEIKNSYQAIRTEQTRAKTLEGLGKGNGDAPDASTEQPAAVPKSKTARGSRRSFRRPRGRGRPRHAEGTKPPDAAPAPSPRDRPSVRKMRLPTAAEKAAAQNKARDERAKSFNEAQALCRKGDFAGARSSFHELALLDPQERKYRVWMHYAWGREHAAADRAEEARSEYNRTLTLDPRFDEAKTALAELDAKTKKRGVFSRLFRK